jgi:hypothetical protein
MTDNLKRQNFRQNTPLSIKIRFFNVEKNSVNGINGFEKIPTEIN